MKTTLRAALAAAAITLPLAATAQLEVLRNALGAIPGLPGAGGSRDRATANPDTLVRTYIAADKDVLLANADMADALGLKDAAAVSRATANALNEGATVDGLKEADKAVTTSTDLVAQEMKKSPQLDERAKKKFAAGLLRLAQGVSKYASLRKPLQGLASATPDLAILTSGRASSLAYVGSNFPSGMSNLGGALNNAVAFARSNDIPVPADATQALAAL